MPVDIDFQSHGETLKAHLYLPKDTSSEPHPVVILCHGFCGVKELLLPAYAEQFAQHGFAALTFDYRGFGESGGEPGRLVPQLQIEDIVSAIDWVAQEPSLDGDKIALWGSSFGGANAIVAAAKDNRVKALLCQLTFANGERVITGEMDEQEKAKFVATLDKMLQKKRDSGKEMMVPIAKVLSDEQSKAFFLENKDAFPALSIKIPFLTVYETMQHKPADFIADINQPVLFIAAENDSVNPVSETEELYQLANEPKALHIEANASHYDLYQGESFDRVIKQQLSWLSEHLAA